MYIAFFDSGIGGITVLHTALELLPDNVKYLYYADTEHVPYGTKKKNVVKRHIHKAADFIIKQGVDALVVACNTATSIAIQDLRNAYQVPIIGMEPAVKPAVEICGDRRVLVLATPLTLKEDKYEDLVSKVDSDHIVDSLPLPELVNYAEKFQFEEEEVIEFIQSKLSSYDLDQYGTIVLGCTHFVYYRDILSSILPSQIDIIDGNMGTVQHLKNVMGLNDYDNDTNIDRDFRINNYNHEELYSEDISFYISGRKENNSVLYRYLDRLMKLK
ncbi:MAG: glutamate racemase [Halanaerobiales bacterium]